VHERPSGRGGALEIHYRLKLLIFDLDYRGGVFRESPAFGHDCRNRLAHEPRFSGGQDRPENRPTRRDRDRGIVLNSQYWDETFKIARHQNRVNAGRFPRGFNVE
jgi:hypothetical protein